MALMRTLTPLRVRSFRQPVSQRKLIIVRWKTKSCLDAQVKSASLAHAPVIISAETVAEEEFTSPAVETTEYPVQSDPTIAHAGLTEIDTETATALANGHDDKAPETALGVPQNSGIDEGAANAAADSHWDANVDMSASQEWVDVSLMRETSET